MGVVFDEVVTQVEAPPPGPEAPRAPGAEASPQSAERHWHQQQATFRRREQRLEAD